MASRVKELRDELRFWQEQKRRIRGRRGPDAAQTRYLANKYIKEIRAELRRLGEKGQEKSVCNLGWNGTARLS